MIRHRLIWTGKEHKQSHESKLCLQYLERIRRYAKFDQLTLKPFGKATPEVVKAKEGSAALRSLDRDDFLVLLDERGQSLDTPSFARFLDRQCHGHKRVNWLIGGAMGVSQELRQRSDNMLSLSRLTLPHALVRVLLLEQLYRAFTILAGHPYHHEG